MENETDKIINNKLNDFSEIGLTDKPFFNDMFNYYIKKFKTDIENHKKYISKYLDLILDQVKFIAFAINEDNLESVFDTTLFYMSEWFKLKQRNLVSGDIISKKINDIQNDVLTAEKNIRTKINEGKVEKIFEDKKWLVIKINSMEASCKYGSNTKWCISASENNRFSDHGYSENNHIYFIIDKNDKSDDSDVLYKMAVLINKKTRFIQIWDAQDHLLTTKEVNIVYKFIPEIFESISKHSTNIIDINKIKSYLSSSLSTINNYTRYYIKITNNDNNIHLEYDGSRDTKHYIKITIDLEKSEIITTMLYFDESSQIKPDVISQFTLNDKINNNNLPRLVYKSFNNLMKTPEVKEYFNENNNEYFKLIGLYHDLEYNYKTKVPKKAFEVAIKLLKEKGEQNITTIRRIVDPKLQSSHSVKPLLKSLYKFDLITLQKRGKNVFVVPTPKLIKTPLNKLI